MTDPNETTPAMSSFEDSGLSLNDPNETVALNSFEDSVFVWHSTSRNGIQNITIDQEDNETKTSDGFNGSGSPNGKMLISLDESTQNPLILVEKSSNNNLSSIQLDSTDRKLNSTKISSTTINDEVEKKKDLMDDGVANSSGNGTLMKLLNLSEIQSSSEVSQAPLESYPSISGGNNSESIVSDEQKICYKFDNNDSKEPVSGGSSEFSNLLEIAFTKTPQTSSTDLEFPLLMDMEQNVKARNSLKNPDSDSPEKHIKFSTEPDRTAATTAPLIDVFDVACPNLSTTTTTIEQTGTAGPMLGNLLDISTSQITADKIKIDARISPAHLLQQQLDYKSKNLLDLSLEQIETPVEICHNINPILEKKPELSKVVEVVDNMMKDDENLQLNNESNSNSNVEKKDVVFNETSLIDLNNAFCDSLLEISLPTADVFETSGQKDCQAQAKLDSEQNPDHSSVERIEESKPEVVDENHNKSSERLSNSNDNEESSKSNRSPFIQLDANRIKDDEDDQNKSVKMLTDTCTEEKLLKKEKLQSSAKSSERKNAARKIPGLKPPSQLKANANRFGFIKKVPSKTKTKLSSISAASVGPSSSIPMPNTLANVLEVGGGISSKNKMAKLNNGSRLPTLKRNI